MSIMCVMNIRLINAMPIKTKNVHPHKSFFVNKSQILFIIYVYLDIFDEDQPAERRDSHEEHMDTNEGHLDTNEGHVDTNEGHVDMKEEHSDSQELAVQETSQKLTIIEVKLNPGKFMLFPYPYSIA